jgi:hypothetical protein
MTQPQPMPDGRSIIVCTQGGLVLIGRDRHSERIIPHDPMRAFTTPYPLSDGRILCGSTSKTHDRNKVDIGLYTVDPKTGSLTSIYNDPDTADYEARPIVPRRREPVLPSLGTGDQYTGRLMCGSVFVTQEPLVKKWGKLVRVIEGVPMAARHSTQTNEHPVWKAHSGTVGRVLGTVPLAADGSINLEVPADRLIHLQVLDADRLVVGNQLTWMNVRGGERRTCIGCHQKPNTTSQPMFPSQAAGLPSTACLPTGRELRYRAKAWAKGSLPDAIEDRTRTVRAINLLAH